MCISLMKVTLEFAVGLFSLGQSVVFQQLLQYLQSLIYEDESFQEGGGTRKGKWKDVM